MQKKKMVISNFVCTGVYIGLSVVIVSLCSRSILPEVLIHSSGPALHLQFLIMAFNEAPIDILTFFNPAIILFAGVYLGGMVCLAFSASSRKARITFVVLWLICAIINDILYNLGTL